MRNHLKKANISSNDVVTIFGLDPIDFYAFQITRIEGVKM